MRKKYQAGEDLLITAVEGGSNYWAEFMNYDPRGEMPSVEVRDVEQLISVTGEYPGQWRKVTAKDLQDAAKKVAKEPVAYGVHPDYGKTLLKVLRNPEDADHDATDADIALQVACFDRVIFG